MNAINYIFRFQRKWQLLSIESLWPYMDLFEEHTILDENGLNNQMNLINYSLNPNL